MAKDTNLTLEEITNVKKYLERAVKCKSPYEYEDVIRDISLWVTERVAFDSIHYFEKYEEKAERILGVFQITNHEKIFGQHYLPPCIYMLPYLKNKETVETCTKIAINSIPSAGSLTQKKVFDIAIKQMKKAKRNYDLAQKYPKVVGELKEGYEKQYEAHKEILQKLYNHIFAGLEDKEIREAHKYLE